MRSPIAKPSTSEGCIMEAVWDVWINFVIGGLQFLEKILFTVKGA